MTHRKKNDLCHTKLPHFCAVRPLFCGASTPPLHQPRPRYSLPPPTPYDVNHPPSRCYKSLYGVTKSPCGVTNPSLWCYKYKFSLVVLQMPPPLPPPPFVVLQIPVVVLQILVRCYKSPCGVTNPRVVLQIPSWCYKFPPPPPRGVTNPPRGVANLRVVLQGSGDSSAVRAPDS